MAAGIKVAIVGPPQVGKSSIANEMAEHESHWVLGESHPTSHLRILPTSVQLPSGPAKIDIWDAGRNPAVLKPMAEDADGVMYVVNPSSVASFDYSPLVQLFTDVPVECQLVLLHQMSGIDVPAPLRPFSSIRTSLDSPDAITDLRAEFSRLVTAIHRHIEADGL